MTSFQYLTVMVALCLLSGISAFNVPSTLPRAERVSSFSKCFLHPDQAADLEACAYDLTKEFLEQERRKKEAAAMCDYKTPVDPNTMTTIPGPVAWCRRRLWPFANKNNLDLRP